MDIYARVIGGKVVEFPVYPAVITARGQTPAMYAKCEFDAEPELTEFQYVETTKTVAEDGSVKVSFVVKDKSLDALLSRFPDPNAPKAVQAAQKAPSDAFIAKVVALSKERIQQQLDTFAGTHDYGTPPGGPKSLESAISYAGSKNAVRAADAAYAHELRDDTWDAAEAYFKELTATPPTKPYPRRWGEIQAVLPTMKWPDVTPA